MGVRCRVERWDLGESGSARVALDPLAALDGPVVVFDAASAPDSGDRPIVGRLDWRDRTWDLVGPERVDLRWIEDGKAWALLRLDLVDPTTGRVQGGYYRVVQGGVAG